MMVNRAFEWGRRRAANLLKDVLFQIGATLIPDFDVGDV